MLLFACRHIIICISNSVVFLNLCSFLQRVVGSLVSLLKSGADREPEIIEQVQIMVSMNFFAIPFFCFLSGWKLMLTLAFVLQIFTSWSYIIMYSQKYLIRDIVHVLKVTVKLRYFPKDYVQEFMAEAVSFLLRNAPLEQLIKGITIFIVFYPCVAFCL